MLRAKRKTNPPIRRSTPILLSEINSRSTCITLNIPYSIACRNCKPQLDPLQNTRKKRKTERQKSDDRQCERYWLTEYASKSNSTEGHVIMHRTVRQYLRIDQDVIINFESRYMNNNDTVLNNYDKIDMIITANKVNNNVQEEISPPQVIGDSSSAATACCRSSQDEGLDKLQKLMLELYPRKSKTKTLFTLLLDTITESKRDRVEMLRQTLDELVSEDEDSVDDAIVNNVRSFLSSTKGRDTTLELQTKQAILTACTYSGSGNKVELERIREVLGVSKKSFYRKTIMRTNKLDTYKPVVRSNRETKWAVQQRRCVLEFCHSDDSSSIDSNSRKIITIDGIPHVGRVWLAKTIDEQYQMFLVSDVLQNMTTQEPQFHVPSKSFFYHNRCPCVSVPVLQSCVDIRMSKCMHYIRALGKVIRRPDMKMMLESCSCEQQKNIKSEQWQTYLSSRVEDLVEVSCCNRIEHPHLTYGVGSGARVPKLLKWDCVNNVCAVCGVDTKLQMKTCEILSNSELVIDVLEWINAPRQGMKKGKQNTQLELGLQKVAVKDVVDRLRDALVVCRIHMAQYQWRDTMRKIDTIMSDKNLHRCIMTDFGATLDLSAAEKDNSSVDSHAVICIFFVNFNWRDVKFKRMVEGVGLVDDVTRVSDCEKWIFLAIQYQQAKRMIMYFTMHAKLTSSNIMIIKD